MKPITLSARQASGQIVFLEPARAAAWLSMAKDQTFTVTLEREPKRRSLLQNSRYWVAYVPFVQECLEQKYDTPFSRDMAHHAMCVAFIGHIVIEIGGQEITIRKESKKLSTEEFAKFTDDVEQYIEQTWNINPALIQTPEDIP